MRLPADTPPTVRLLLRLTPCQRSQCLLCDIGDVKIELEAAIADPTSSELGLADSPMVPVTGASFWSLRRIAVVLSAMAVTAIDICRCLEPLAPDHSDDRGTF